MDVEKFYRMNLHDYVLDGGMCITRVPGGWIYYFEDQCTFVPFNNEFQGAAPKTTDSVQHLKDEIAATVAELKVYKYHGGDPEFVRLITKLERQLSAV
jgi:hypothetical protein